MKEYVLLIDGEQYFSIRAKSYDDAKEIFLNNYISIEEVEE